MRRLFSHWLVPLLLTVLIVACGTMSPQTFNDKAAVASASITSVTEAANTLAANTKITKAQATNVLNASRSASVALSMAQTMAAGGDATGANSQLEMASSITSGLKAFLISQGATIK